VVKDCSVPDSLCKAVPLSVETLRGMTLFLLYGDGRMGLLATRCHHSDPRNEICPVSQWVSCDVVLAGREGDKSSALTTSIWYRCSPLPQMVTRLRSTTHFSRCHRCCHSLHCLAQVGFRAGYLIEAKRIFSDEMIKSYNCLILAHQCL
jgi:hypothetical protein